MSDATERVNSFLRSEAALLTLLAMALISQTPHTAVLFHRLSPAATGAINIATWLHAVAYAVALEFATLVFVVRGQRYLAWGFAIVSGVVNLLYYATGELTPLYIASAVLVSIALPASIAFYSHSVAAQAGGHVEHVSEPIAQVAPPSPVAVPGSADSPVAGVTVPDDTVDAPSADIAPVDERQQAKLLKSEGLSNAQIARQLGRNPATVGRWLANGVHA